MRGIALYLCGMLVLYPLAGTAQQPQLKQREGLVLRSTTRLVQVNVVVQGKHGEPLTGLRKEHFTLTDNGRPQQIAVFAENSNAALPVSAAPLGPNLFTNRLEQKSGTPASITVILFDSLNTPYADQAYARSQLVRFLQQIRPQDRIGIYTLGSTLRVLHDYTADSSELLRKLSGGKVQHLPNLTGSEPPGGLGGEALLLDQWLRGSGASGAERDFYMANRVTGTLRALEFIAGHLARVAGRKNLIWVSGGFPLTIGFDNVAAWHDPSRTQMTFGAEIDRTVRAINDANLAIYPVDARGLMVDPQFTAERRGMMRPNPLRPPVGVRNQETMRELASRTGGRAYYNNNDIQGAIRDAVNDSRVTYTLGYYPADARFDGQFHEIKVSLEQPGAKLRYRKGYFDLADQPQDEKLRKAELRDAVFSPLDATELGLTVRVSPHPDALEVQVQIDPQGLGLQPHNDRWNGRLDVLLVQKDAQGRQYNGRNDTIEMQLKQENYERLVRSGLTYRQRVQRAARATELRIVVRDAASGAVGSVTVPFGDLKS